VAEVEAIHATGASSMRADT
jgi:hypothetical protein